MSTHRKTKQGTKKTRVRKSVPLTTEQHDAFREWVAEQPTKIDAAEKVGVTRDSLDGLLSRGTGKPENINRIKVLIRKKLNKAA